MRPPILKSLLTTLALATVQAIAPGPVAHAAPPPNQRDFYATVDDTLGDFEFDLKHEAVKGVDNIAIRDIVVSENVPRSFTPHLEGYITERILRATKSKVIQCLGCRARRTTLKEGEISMTSPQTNQKELQRLAKARGIQHFLDVTFTYQPTGIIVSMTITEPATANVIWSRTYNSESSRAALLRRGLDMDQLDPSTRRSTEYPAILQYRVSVDYLFEPNVSGTTGCLGFAFRMVERYDNRKKEIGFEAEYLKDSTTLLNNTSTAPNLYSGVNLTLLMLHGFNLIGSEEDFNQARANVYAGLGGTYTSGYLGALIRTGFEYRMAKHFATTLHLGYRPSSTVFLPISSVTTSVSGFEYGGGISFMF